MRIRFNKGDPRAGMEAEMDSQRGQQFIEEGIATQISDSANAKAESVAPENKAEKAAPANKSNKQKR